MGFKLTILKASFLAHLMMSTHSLSQDTFTESCSGNTTAGKMSTVPALTHRKLQWETQIIHSQINW